MGSRRAKKSDRRQESLGAMERKGAGCPVNELPGEAQDGALRGAEVGPVEPVEVDALSLLKQELDSGIRSGGGSVTTDGPQDIGHLAVQADSIGDALLQGCELHLPPPWFGDAMPLIDPWLGVRDGELMRGAVVDRQPV